MNGFSTNPMVCEKIKEQVDRFDILVTEIFDDGLLGEECFKIIRHAKAHLLKENAQLIPYRARVMAMAIESEEILNNFRVSQEVNGFNLEAFNEHSQTGYVGIHLDKMAYRPLCTPIPVFDFDFNAIPKHNQSIPLSMPVISAGKMHAMVYWFELFLDTNTIVSSGPGLEQLSSWKQSVVIATKVDNYQSGETIQLIAHHDDLEIWFTNP